jgi:hypothetical protein
MLRQALSLLVGEARPDLGLICIHVETWPHHTHTHTHESASSVRAVRAHAAPTVSAHKLHTFGGWSGPHGGGARVGQGVAQSLGPLVVPDGRAQIALQLRLLAQLVPLVRPVCACARVTLPEPQESERARYKKGWGERTIVLAACCVCCALGKLSCAGPKSKKIQGWRDKN